jgi:hypothetical protein
LQYKSSSIAQQPHLPSWIMEGWNPTRSWCHASLRFGSSLLLLGCSHFQICNKPLYKASSLNLADLGRSFCCSLKERRGTRWPILGRNFSIFSFFKKRTLLYIRPNDRFFPSWSRTECCYDQPKCSILN